MSVTLTHSAERLTWDEIVKKYPDTWVGMSDIKFRNDDGTNIETAVVSATGTRDELYDRVFDHKLQMVSPTNLEQFTFYNWMTWPA